MAANATVTNPLLKIAAGIVAMLLLAFAWLNLQYSFAHVYGHSANQYIKQWKSINTIPSDQAWQKALEYATKADQIQTNNPIHLHRLGEIFELRADYSPINNESQTLSYLVASSYYEKTAQHRTIWSWDWLAIFRANIKLGKIDKNSMAALDTATALDPNGYRLLLNVAQYGLAGYSQPNIKEQVDVATRNILQNSNTDNHRKLTKIYQAYNQQEMLCQTKQQLNINSKALNYCEKHLQ